MEIYPTDVAKLRPAFPIQVQWGGKPVAGFEVFAGQKWAEPSEPIAESLLVALPRADGHIYRLALKVVSVRIWWTAETIVEDFLIVVTRGGRHDDHTIPDHGRG